MRVWRHRRMWGVRVEGRARGRKPRPWEVWLLRGPRWKPAAGARPRRGRAEGAGRRVRRAREPRAGRRWSRRGGERRPGRGAGWRRERREWRLAIAALPRRWHAAAGLVQRRHAPLQPHRHLSTRTTCYLRRSRFIVILQLEKTTIK